MADRYDELLGAGRDALLQTINPDRVLTVNHCPATADAIDDYLRGEDLRRAEVDEVLGQNDYAIQGRGRRRELNLIINRLRGAGHGHHFVIRGNRAAGSSMAATHYFILANIRGAVYVVDAYTREVNRNVQEYVRRQEFVSYDLFRTFDAALASH